MAEKESWQARNDWRIMSISVVILMTYVIGMIFPDAWWGTHHLAFFPGFVQLVIGLGIGWLFYQTGTERFFQWISSVTFQKWLPPLLAVIAVLLFLTFPYDRDVYGDAERHVQFMGEYVTELNMERVSNLFNLNVFEPKIGEQTVLNAIELIAYYSGASVVHVFQWTSAIFGGMFVWVWSAFSIRYFNNNTLRFIALLLGLLSPVVQLFFGHVEIYAPAIAMMTAYLVVLLRFIETKKRSTGIWSFLFLFLSLKFHFAAILLVPSVVLSWWWVLKPESANKWLNWKQVFRWGFLPMIAIGIFAYVYIFEDHRDLRFLDGQIAPEERLFLPLFSPEEPLDRYNLLGLNHLWDLLNQFLLWSSAGIFLLICFYRKRKHVDWNRPEVVIAGISVVLLIGLFFMINPLLSMPLDWDLFMIPVPAFLIFTATVLKHSNLGDDFRKGIVPSVVVLSLCTIPMVIVNTSPESNAQRLISIGKHSFKTYWIRSAGTIEAGLRRSEKDFSAQLIEVVNELEPYAVIGRDLEFAHLLTIAGQDERSRGEIDRAVKWHLLAEEYGPDYGTNIVELMDLYYAKEEFVKAFEYSQRLVEIEFPNRERSLKMAIDCGVRSGRYTQVDYYCREYLNEFEKDQFLADALDILKENGIGEELMRENEQIANELKKAFIEKSFDEAFFYAEQLVERKYPDEGTAISVAIHCALEAKMYKQAKNYSQRFLNIYPGHEKINYVYAQLQSGTNLSNLKKVFEE